MGSSVRSSQVGCPADGVSETGRSDMTTRTVAVAAAAVGAAALATTGITYASAAGSAQGAPFVQQAAPAMAPDGGGSGERGEGDEGRDRDRDYDYDYDYDYREEGRIQFNE